MSFLLKENQFWQSTCNKSSGFRCSYTVQKKRGNIIGSLPTLNSTGTDIDIMSKIRLNYLDNFNFLWYKEQWCNVFIFDTCIFTISLIFKLASSFLSVLFIQLFLILKNYTYFYFFNVTEWKAVINKDIIMQCWFHYC